MAHTTSPDPTGSGDAPPWKMDRTAGRARPVSNVDRLPYRVLARSISPCFITGDGADCGALGSDWDAWL